MVTNDRWSRNAGDRFCCIEVGCIRPGVIVICNSNSNDYSCSSNSDIWNRMQCNSNRKQSN